MNFLDCMANGILDIVGKRLPIEMKYEESSEKYDRWVKVYDMLKAMGKVIIKRSNELVLSGKKTNNLYTKILDRYYANEQAARIITKNAKMYLAKKKLQILKQSLILN